MAITSSLTSKKSGVILRLINGKKRISALYCWGRDGTGGVAVGMALGRSLPEIVLGLGEKPDPHVNIEPPDPEDLALFESGKIFSGDIIKDEEKLVKIVEISSQFPVVSTRFDRDRQTPFKEIPLEIDSAQLAKVKASGISLLIAYGEHVGVMIDLKENVFLGYDFDMEKRGGTPYPAFIAIVDQANPSDRKIRPTSTFHFFGNDFQKEPISGAFIAFYAKVDEISGKDFCVIFNRGVFRHQMETAMILPIRFNVTFTGYQYNPSPLQTQKAA